MCVFVRASAGLMKGSLIFKTKLNEQHISADSRCKCLALKCEKFSDICSCFKTSRVSFCTKALRMILFAQHASFNTNDFMNSDFCCDLRSF